MLRSEYNLESPSLHRNNIGMTGVQVNPEECIQWFSSTFTVQSKCKPSGPASVKPSVEANNAPWKHGPPQPESKCQSKS